MPIYLSLPASSAKHIRQAFLPNLTRTFWSRPSSGNSAGAFAHSACVEEDVALAPTEHPPETDMSMWLLLWSEVRSTDSGRAEIPTSDFANENSQGKHRKAQWTPSSESRCLGGNVLAEHLDLHSNPEP